MNTKSKPRQVKPLPKRQREIRTMLRENQTITIKDVSEALDVCEPYAHKLLNSLVKMRHVYIVYTVETGRGGKPQNVYALTTEYLTGLVKSREYIHASRSTQAADSYADMPWYKRLVMRWLFGKEGVAA